MFAKLSLKSKLIGAFCIVATLTAIVAFAGYRGIHSSATRLESIAVVGIPSLNAIDEVDAQQTAIRGCVARAINPFLSKETRAHYTEDVKEAWTRLDEQWKIYEPLPQIPEEAALWKEFTPAFETWKQRWTEMDRLVTASLQAKDQKDLEAQCVIMAHEFEQKLNPAARTSKEKLDRLHEVVSKWYGVDEPQQALVAASVNQKIGLFTALISILAAVAFGLFLSLNISRLLNKISTSAGEAANQIASASTQVSTSSQGVAAGSQQQAASIEESSSSLEELSAMTKQNADNSSSVQSLVVESMDLIKRAQSGVVSMQSAMQEIKSASSQTSKIIKTIDEIAFQTNLLALNAAVEAARAGEAGKGFAVVAEEVRNLAMRAAEAAKNTGSLIEENVTRVNGGVQIASDLNAAISEVTNSSEKVANLVSEVAAASNEQARGIDQLNLAINQMSSATQQNAANAEEAASAAEETGGQAEELRDLVNQLVRFVQGQNASATTLRRPPISSRANLPTRTMASSVRPLAMKSPQPSPMHSNGAISANQAIPLDDDLNGF